MPLQGAPGIVRSLIENPAYLKINESCDLMQVSRRTIYNWIRDHKVTYIRTAGGRVRILSSSLWQAGDR